MKDNRKVLLIFTLGMLTGMFIMSAMLQRSRNQAKMYIQPTVTITTTTNTPSLYPSSTIEPSGYPACPKGTKRLCEGGICQCE